MSNFEIMPLNRAYAEIFIIKYTADLIKVIQDMEDVHSYDREWLKMSIKRDYILSILVGSVEKAFHDGVPINKCVTEETKQVYNMVYEKVFQTHVKEGELMLAGETLYGELSPEQREEIREKLQHRKRFLASDK